MDFLDRKPALINQDEFIELIPSTTERIIISQVGGNALLAAACSKSAINQVDAKALHAASKYPTYGIDPLVLSWEEAKGLAYFLNGSDMELKGENGTTITAHDVAAAIVTELAFREIDFNCPDVLPPDFA